MPCSNQLEKSWIGIIIDMEKISHEVIDNSIKSTTAKSHSFIVLIEKF